MAVSESSSFTATDSNAGERSEPYGYREQRWEGEGNFFTCPKGAEGTAVSETALAGERYGCREQR